MLFSSLSTMADSKGAMVGELWENQRGEGTWNPRFFRPFNDWEMEAAQNFINLIRKGKVSQGGRDRIFWKVDKQGQYSVKTNYRHLEQGTHSQLPVNLEQLCPQLVSRCPVRCKAEENLEHLRIHCPAVWSQWAALISISGLDWACPLRARDLLLGWNLVPIRNKARKLWKAAPLCLFWAIWKERNRVVFEDDSFSYDRLKLYFINSLISWAGLIFEGDISIASVLLCIL